MGVLAEVHEAARLLACDPPSGGDVRASHPSGDPKQWRAEQIARNELEMAGVLARWEALSGQRLAREEIGGPGLSGILDTESIRAAFSGFILNEIPQRSPDIQAHLLYCLAQAQAPFDLTTLTGIYDTSAAGAMARNVIAGLLDESRLFPYTKLYPGSKERIAAWLERVCSETTPCSTRPLLFPALVRFAAAERALPVLRRQFPHHPGIVAMAIRSKRIGGPAELELLRDGLERLAELPGYAELPDAARANTVRWARRELLKTMDSLARRGHKPSSPR